MIPVSNPVMIQVPLNVCDGFLGICTIYPMNVNSPSFLLAEMRFIELSLLSLGQVICMRLRGGESRLTLC